MHPFVSRVVTRAWGTARRHPRLRAVLRVLLAPIRHVLPHRGVPPVPAPPGDAGDPVTYRRWVALHDGFGAADLAAIRMGVAAMATRPRVSVLLPVGEAAPALLERAIASVRRQAYAGWELCLAPLAALPPGLAAVMEAARAADPTRVKVAAAAAPAAGPPGAARAAALNRALALATGDLVVMPGAADLLAPQALYLLASAYDRHPETVLAYADADRITPAGGREAPHFKPDFDPDLLLGQDYVSRSAAFPRALLLRLGGLREALGAAADYDLALRVVAAGGAGRVRHVAAVLFHRAGADAPAPGAAEAGQAVADFLRATGQAAAGVAPCPPPAAGALPLRVHWPLPGPPPLASVIVPTRDHPDLLARCAEGVLQDTAYAPLELLVIDNGSTEPATHALLGRLRQDPRVRVLDAPGPFNYAALNNRAVAAARGEVLVLLNNDVAVIEPGWLGEMVAHALRPGIGAVGARLLYADGRVQHGGVVLGVGGVASHYHPFAGREDPGYHGALRLVRRVAAVTAACLAMRRTVFEAVGGLDAEHLAVAFNDVDLCLRIRAAGHAIVWTPHAELYHLESVSRGFDGAPQNRERFAREVAYMRGRWGPALDADPYYSPNFSLQDAGFNLAFPPRRSRRWEAGGVAPPGAPPEAPPGAPPEAPPGVLPEVLAAAR